MRRGFTLLDTMIVLLIMSIVGGLGFGAISAYEASARPERAARECLLAFRYARSLAMATGKPTKVTFDTGTNAFSVYWMSNGSTWDTNAVAQPLAPGGTYAIRMDSTPELQGVTMSLDPAGTTAFTYNAQGNLDNTSTVTFRYGSHAKTLRIARVGDPTID